MLTDQDNSSLLDSMFGFDSIREQDEVRAFYGARAYEAIRRQESDACAWERIKHETAPSLLDDVAGQIAK